MGVLNVKVEYGNLKNKQKEIYNFQRVSAIFAEYGYSVTTLRDDVEFADFVAVPFLRDDGPEPLFVQLKGGLTLWDMYLKKNLYICFPDDKSKTWYLYPHDELYTELESELRERVKDGDKKLEYKRAPSFPAWAKDFLDKYKIDQ
jgi:hypothetical protein